MFPEWDEAVAEVDRNLQAFLEQRPLIKVEHSGECALLRSAQVVGFYQTILEAQQAGEDRYADGLFSVQEVDGEVIDLGVFSHAVDLWKT